MAVWNTLPPRSPATVAVCVPPVVTGPNVETPAAPETETLATVETPTVPNDPVSARPARVLVIAPGTGVTAPRVLLPNNPATVTDKAGVVVVATTEPNEPADERPAAPTDWGGDSEYVTVSQLTAPSSTVERFDAFPDAAPTPTNSTCTPAPDRSESREESNDALTRAPDVEVTFTAAPDATSTPFSYKSRRACGVFTPPTFRTQALNVCVPVRPPDGVANPTRADVLIPAESTAVSHDPSGLSGSSSIAANEPDRFDDASSEVARSVSVATYGLIVQMNGDVAAH